MTTVYCQHCVENKTILKHLEEYEVSRGTTPEQAEEIQSKLKHYVFSIHPEVMKDRNPDE
jgi:hypothetical protein